MDIHLIAAVGQGGELGKRGALCWRIKEDLAMFKSLTMGFPIVMGRKTFASLPKVLPGRKHYVLTRSATPLQHPRAESSGQVFYFRDFEAMLAYAHTAGDSKLFVIGGGALYQSVLPQVHQMFLTRIAASDPEADTFFPDWDVDAWELKRTSMLAAAPVAACMEHWSRKCD
ncbi:MAG: dihydrofolate reductase [Zetaproteobacteria bacterium]|nr:dihydrofolate reductase [Zetaproteobacteria bacterium]